MSGCGGAAWLRACTQGSAVLCPAARLLGLVYLRARLCNTPTWQLRRCLFRRGHSCRARPEHEVMVVESGGQQRDGAGLCVWGVFCAEGTAVQLTWFESTLLLVRQGAGQRMSGLECWCTTYTADNRACMPDVQKLPRNTSA